MERFSSRAGNSLIFLILLISLLNCGAAILNFEIGSPFTSVSLDNGKKQMDALIANSKLPVGSGPTGECWKSGIEDLQIACRFLTEEIQSRMALRFTSCFNLMFGLDAYICEKSTPIQTCLQQMSPDDRGTFKDYFLHTQDMCYYLRQEIWQEQTNEAVTRLTGAAEDVTVQMIEQKEIQDQIYQSQQESLKVQSSIVKDNEDLYSAVVKVKDVFDDFSVSTREHQVITTEIFDKLGRMHKLVSWIQGEMSLFDAVFFYGGAIILGIFATSTSRTKSARFYLVILFMVTIWGEGALHKYLNDGGYGIAWDPEDVKWAVWCVRKICALLGCTIVVVLGAIYRDPQEFHTNMINNMKFTLEQVATYIKDGRPGNEDQYDSDSSEDSYTNYSTDGSVDSLQNELSDLAEEAENAENVAPGTPAQPLSPVNRYFGKEPNKVKTPSPNTSSMRQNHRYNLRERSATPRDNPAVLQESVTQFARAIKRRRTPQPRSNVTPRPANNAPRYNCFSSDEEL